MINKLISNIYDKEISKLLYKQQQMIKICYNLKDIVNMIFQYEELEALEIFYKRASLHNQVFSGASTYNNMYFYLKSGDVELFFFRKVPLLLRKILFLNEQMAKNVQKRHSSACLKQLGVHGHKNALNLQKVTPISAKYNGKFQLQNPPKIAIPLINQVCQFK
ncbi:unnamed protein product [Paramecium octaurelia]|uniref:Uncharacterized protein n=1 Tax=Paramecium octaurelia TaxID=43137 RepID=A0A8S1TDS3_PAROT|nr:unnamed protein product [Paramecium octaurelia]